jgi:hypothetical protein
MHSFFETAMFLPPMLLEKYQNDRLSNEAQDELFRHISNHVCRNILGIRPTGGSPMFPLLMLPLQRIM